MVRLDNQTLWSPSHHVVLPSESVAKLVEVLREKTQALSRPLNDTELKALLKKLVPGWYFDSVKPGNRTFTLKPGGTRPLGLKSAG